MQWSSRTGGHVLLYHRVLPAHDGRAESRRLGSLYRAHAPPALDATGEVSKSGSPPPSFFCRKGGSRVPRHVGRGGVRMGVERHRLECGWPPRDLLDTGRSTQAQPVGDPCNRLCAQSTAWRSRRVVVRLSSFGVFGKGRRVSVRLVAKWCTGRP